MQGTNTIDHTPAFVEEFGGEISSTAYGVGYMKALLKAAVNEGKA